MKIRLMTEQDFPEIKGWWGPGHEFLTIETYPLDSTYVVEDQGLLTLVTSMYYTNCKLAVFMEGTCGNPLAKGPRRREALCHLLEFCEGEARKRGYKKLIATANTSKVAERWKEIGFQPVLENVSYSVKEI